MWHSIVSMTFKPASKAHLPGAVRLFLPPAPSEPILGPAKPSTETCISVWPGCRFSIFGVGFCDASLGLQNDPGPTSFLSRFFEIRQAVKLARYDIRILSRTIATMSDAHIEAWYISVRSNFRHRRCAGKSRGTFQAFVSNTASLVFYGGIAGIIVIPPPVIWSTIL